MVKTKDKKSALVVDDSRSQRSYIRALLIELGYQVHTAENGAVGVNKFSKYHPDIVLMDINMPIMDGFEAAKIIKSTSNNGFCPLIFVTTMNSEKTTLESAQVGGDGILVMPFTPEVFKAKIMSLQRISDLYQELTLLQQSQLHDAELAEQVMASVIDSRNYSPEYIAIVKQAASLFSGDIQLSERCPNGDVNILLGDFTGHGLRSSVGAIPVAETFRTMTKKGFSLLEITSQLNQQLYELLPSDLFLAAGLATVSFDEKSFYVVNAGIPDILLIGDEGMVKHHITSSHPPLGIMPRLLPSAALDVFAMEITDNLLMISDGVIEARNSAGEFYGEQRLHQLISHLVGEHDVARLLLNDVNLFVSGVEQGDDISIINVACKLFQKSEQEPLSSREYPQLAPDSLPLSEKPSWSWRVVLNDQRLASVNPVPLAMNQLKDIEEDGEHWQSVYTILTELYINALDHGILLLDSSLKNSVEGFSQYFRLRAEKLNQAITGSIAISIDLYSFSRGGKVVIRVNDSGAGFDVESVLKQRINHAQANNQVLSGRGIELVSKLCETLSYNNFGTSVEASYLWE
ncbi:SpoIIE family protein phosphatase [Thalassotalea sp. LPB0316]|uniref:SpoIIE family protein phosphatase n=1 Tax=Thalassotalea sp. LPB0316 TaxID=2769490 RepID=UPI0018678AEC|nr:SpoIIE family protein phosphatase [Thalassotalea sp. LPB0316]QOL24778.1 SpoIIE family protein phosphatase [Thalassotalea sp. LPB0316]